MEKFDSQVQVRAKLNFWDISQLDERLVQGNANSEVISFSFFQQSHDCPERPTSVDTSRIMYSAIWFYITAGQDSAYFTNL